MTTEIRGFELARNEDDDVRWLNINSGLGVNLMGIAVNASRNNNPILAIQPHDERAEPGTPFIIPEDGYPITDGSVCIEFHNEAAIDQMIDFLTRIKTKHTWDQTAVNV